MKKLFVFPAIFFIFTFFAAAQQDFNPAVSQIRAEVRNNLIRLTWTDSPDARGSVFIFRSARPFIGSIPANIRPITVRYGQQYYIDDTEDMTNIYYFIAASDLAGRRYDLIIPRTNSTYVNLAQGQMPFEQAIPAITEADIQAAAAISAADVISNIRARQDGDKVIITYTAQDTGKNALLYRSTQPVRQPQDLLNAFIVQSGFTSSFEDHPVPGFSWYYTVVFEDEITTGSVRIIPGINTTINPVVITGTASEQNAMRPIPLPLLALRDSFHEGFFSPDVPRHSPGESRIQKPPLLLKTPRVFLIDLEAPSGGEESALVQIVQDYFEKLDWEGTRVSLLHYLSLPRSRNIEARARFYLGQSFYYTAHYREALFEFLTFRSHHPVEANAWIDAVLAAMVY